MIIDLCATERELKVSILNMEISALSLLLCLLPPLATGAHVELSSKYPFQKVLFDDLGQFYGLYWNYSIAARTIHFAVNVSTTGWVGFGVSPDGQMPGSDVIIGWVAADGRTYFHVKYYSCVHISAVEHQLVDSE